MRLLLDTHAFVWWAAGYQTLSARARAEIQDAANDKYVSAASAWEIATKFRLGKLSDAALIAETVAKEIAAQGFAELPVTVQQAQRAGSLPGPLKDPFDRMLIAQAMLEQMQLISNESLFDRYGVSRLW